jgi:hypothetical protein
MAGRNMSVIRIARNDCLTRSHALSGAVAHFCALCAGADFKAVNLHQLREINFRTKALSTALKYALGA